MSVLGIKFLLKTDKIWELFPWLIQYILSCWFHDRDLRYIVAHPRFPNMSITLWFFLKHWSKSVLLAGTLLSSRIIAILLFIIQEFHFWNCVLCFKVTVFKQPNYLHNFVQATFNALSPDKVRGALHRFHLLKFHWRYHWKAFFANPKFIFLYLIIWIHSVFG